MKELFKTRSFLWIWLGQAASALGGTFAVFIMSWLVYDLTGSKIAMGSIWVFFMIPSLLTQLLSGPYLDRWDRRSVMVFSEWLRAGVFLAGALLYFTNLLTLWHMYAIAVLMGIAEPLFRPASMAYVAQVLPKERLMKGNSFLEGTNQLMMLIGPALGGVLLQFTGAGFILGLLVLTLAGAGFFLCLLPKSDHHFEKKESWFSQFKEGLSFYKMYPVLLGVGLLLMVMNFCTGAAIPMFLPYVTDYLGGNSIQYGLFTSAFSLGMILGAVITGSLKEPKNRRAVMLGVALFEGSLFIVLGISTNFIVSFIVTVLHGILAITFNIHNTTLYQRRVPDHLRGRVFAVRILLAQAGMPVGAMLGSIVAETWSIPILFFIIGGLMTIVTVTAFCLPIFHQLNDDVSAPAKDAAAP
ncbi:MFS transporter [Bacillus gobiensis]|uniref:MFS transporter n=1 Tax=Bacillus gobiensis TaxID=1441095 RepID=UPI003D1FD06C